MVLAEAATRSLEAMMILHRDICHERDICKKYTKLPSWGATGGTGGRVTGSASEVGTAGVRNRTL
jgi:hypothetical protein